MAQGGKVRTIHLNDEDFNFEGQLQLVGPRGEVYILHKATPGITTRALGQQQEVKTLQDHATLAWPCVEKKLQEAEESYTKSVEMVREAFLNYDSFVDKFGQVGIAKAGLWPDKIRYFRLREKKADEELKKIKAGEAKEEEKLKNKKEAEKRKRDEEIARHQAQLEAIKREKEHRARDQEKLREIERQAQEQQAKAKLAKEQARKELREAQLKFENAGVQEIFSHQQAAQEKKKVWAREYRTGPTCFKCGHKNVSRHWLCPDAHLHYLTEKKR